MAVIEGNPTSLTGAKVRDPDSRNADWYVDKAVQAIVFICGISAIIFIVSIFIFITAEGAGFVFGPFDLFEFFWFAPMETDLRI